MGGGSISPAPAVGFGQSVSRYSLSRVSWGEEGEHSQVMSLAGTGPE